VTGGEVKRWLYRCISQDASTEELFGADQKHHFEALERLADFVQHYRRRTSVSCASPILDLRQTAIPLPPA